MHSKLEIKLKNLPESSGVYIYRDIKNEVIYVGKAINLKNRVKSYFSKTLTIGEKTKKLVSSISDLEVIKVDSEIEALLLEANLIHKYQPKYNIVLKDNSSFPFIKITINEKFPSITQTRIITEDGARYFGPYTESKTIRFILKQLRLIFSPNLYFFAERDNPLEYNKCIKNIILFLEGKKNLLINKLTTEMNDQVKQECFEKADETKNQIEKITNLTKPRSAPFEYLKNPNLFEDQISYSLQNLSKVLGLKKLQRIECFDVANIQGQFSTASMVVFTNGQKDTKLYRKFKIHMSGKPNDYKMLEEALLRRLKHKEWPTPDLIVVDGGKGQLNTFISLGINVPCLALAKKEEEIYYNDKKIKLDRSSSALKMLQRIRDEAHRFATSYHKKLRMKSLTINS